MNGTEDSPVFAQEVGHADQECTSLMPIFRGVEGMCVYLWNEKKTKWKLNKLPKEKRDVNAITADNILKECVCEREKLVHQLGIFNYQHVNYTTKLSSYNEGNEQISEVLFHLIQKRGAEIKSCVM